MLVLEPTQEKKRLKTNSLRRRWVYKCSNLTLHHQLTIFFWTGGNQHAVFHATVSFWSVLLLHASERTGMQEHRVDF